MKRDQKKGNLRMNGLKSLPDRKSADTKRNLRSNDGKSSGVFIGPDVERTDDKEYVKVLSGKVEHKKPSFAL